MIYRKKCELETVPIGGCIGGKGIVRVEKLFCTSGEMVGKGRAYVRRTLNPGVSIEMHTHEGEMETMVIISGETVHTVDEREQHLGTGGIAATQPGDIHEIAQKGTKPLILTAQVLYTQIRERRAQRKA